MLFSVLMSVYDRDDALFLEEALESLYLQVRKAEQIVIVFDGPINDRLESVVELYKEKFLSSGILFKNVPLPKNVGLGLALAEGCKHCDGKYIIRMDSDDISLNNRFEFLEKFILENPNIDVFGAQIEEFNYKIGDLGLQRQVPLTQAGIVKYAKSRNPFNHVTACIKRDALEDVGGYEGVLWHEDYYLWLKMISNDKKMANMSNVQVYVRVKGFGDRRGGITYLKAELSFLKEATNLGVFNFFDSVLYLLPRVIVRLMPSYFVQKAYRVLRK
tara:strand:+ start:1413 stop:2231 length:819 start_codon:yes stop_codon:yes gene_type:complete